MGRFFGSRQGRARRLALAVGLGSLLAVSATGWASDTSGHGPAAPETFGSAGPTAPKVLKPVRPTPSEKMGITLGTLPEVRLPAVDRDALLRDDAVARRLGKAKGLRYSVGRDVRVSVQDGHWYDLAGGARLWAGEIVSADALGLRLHFQGVRLPAGAELAVYAPASPSQGVARSGYPRFDPDRKVELHEGSAAQSGDFWTGSFPGDRVRVEYLAPAGAAPSNGLPFTVSKLQHLYLDPVAQLAKSLVNEKSAAGACENDVTCYPDWANVARAVSAIGVVGQGEDGLFCSGQLISTQAEDFTPYWLTANHCLSSKGEAASSEFYWLYQTIPATALRLSSRACRRRWERRWCPLAWPPTTRC